MGTVKLQDELVQIVRINVVAGFNGAPGNACRTWSNTLCWKAAANPSDGSREIIKENHLPILNQFSRFDLPSALSL